MADRRGGGTILAVTLLVLAGGGPASAQGVTGSELERLAERASTDPAALAQLRSVREVEGHPVDVNAALAGAAGGELDARLRALAQGAPGADDPAVPAAGARAEAASILAGRRFRPPPVPRPFAGVLRTIGRWLEPISDPLRAGWRWVDRTLAAQLVLVGVIFAGALLVSVRLVGRRAADAVRLSRALSVEDHGLDPDTLEREAAAAERKGDLDRAVRLRFVAGVLRLDRAGVIAYRSSLTTGQLEAAVASASFVALARTFDEIAYGGRPAGEADVQQSKAGWSRVLAEARR